MFTPVQSRASSAYRRVGADTVVPAADSHHLVHLLFEELLQSIANARGAMARKQIPEKCASVGRALSILDEGLKGGLNMAAGGELAERLNGLYDYCILQLTKANALNDDALMVEVRDLLEPLAQAWQEIRPEVSGRPAGAARRG
jgi:flagellar protein FliS